MVRTIVNLEVAFGRVPLFPKNRVMDTLIKLIVKKNPMHKGFLQSALTHLTESERVQLED